ncbi:MAG: sulfurtransferase TusA family protein [Archaeoglobaceae archaeon]
MSKLKFVRDVRADLRVDILHLMCPMHLLKLLDTMNRAKPGQVIEIVTDYDGALDDIPEWCEKNGQEFIGVEESEDYFKFYIRRVR